jgi:hypothetical protein
VVGRGAAEGGVDRLRAVIGVAFPTTGPFPRLRRG